MGKSLSVNPSRRTAVIGLAAMVLIVAANLRPALTSVGPVLGLMSNDTGLSLATLGVLGAVPLIAFAIVSPLVPVLTVRIGPERTVFLALVVLTAGTVVRSLPGWSANLWIGTAVLAAAIAVGNVLLPAIVKRDFGTHIPVMTGVYSAVMSGFAATASGVALPIAVWGGWRVALGIWVLLGALAVIAWAPRVWGTRSTSGPVPSTVHGSRQSMWTSAVAWQVTLFMGTQATTFYLLITWLPTLETSAGVDPITAGWHLFLYQSAGIFSGLGATAFMRGRADQSGVAAVLSALMVVAMAGLLLAPAAAVAWVLLAGLSSGGSFVVALSLLGQRARTVREASRLSGMAQGVGYMLAAAGPIGAGVLFDWAQDWRPPLVAVLAVAAAQLVIGLLAGRDRFTHSASA